mgnify:CR=1 FL=1
MLVDCGTAGSEDVVAAGLARAGASGADVVVTHGHIDHWGCATAFAESVRAHPGVEMSFRFARNGTSDHNPLPVSDLGAMEQAFKGFRSLVTGVPEIIPLHDGQRLGDWEVIWTPGHDPGHVCLWREHDGVLLCGDLLLPGFTPNIQPAPGHEDTLQEFLDSLDRVAALPIQIVLPAHGDPYSDAARRARDLQQHHQERLTTIARLIARAPRSVDYLAGELFGELASPGDRMLAVMETYAHLRHLDRRGFAAWSELGWRAA